MTRAWFGDACAFGRTGAGSQRAASPDRAFIEVRQKLRADHAAEGEKSAEREDRHSGGNTVSVLSEWPRITPVTRYYVSREERHHRVLPFFAPLRNRKLASTGATSIENISAPSSANATVHAIGLNSRPSTLCSVKIGR